MDRLDSVSYLVLHTVAVRGQTSLKSIRKYHVNERGWADIGYHYYIRKNGTIEEGRNEQYIGAHCRASQMNFKSLGICFEGHHDYEEWTEDQKKSFKILCRTLQAKYGIPDENIIGHREAYKQDPPPKTCPGKKIDMDQVRKIYPNRNASKVQTAELEELKEEKIDFDKITINDE